MAGMDQESRNHTVHSCARGAAQTGAVARRRMRRREDELSLLANHPSITLRTPEESVKTGGWQIQFKNI